MLRPRRELLLYFASVAVSSIAGSIGCALVLAIVAGVTHADRIEPPRGLLEFGAGVLMAMLYGTPFCAVGALLAFLAGAALLFDRRVGSSFLLTFGAVAVVIAAAYPLIDLLAIPVAYVATLVALGACRIPERLRLPAQEWQLRDLASGSD